MPALIINQNIEGIAIHLTLSPDSTFSHVNTTLPNKDNLKIIVDILTTKTFAIIWRDIVNLKNISKY